MFACLNVLENANNFHDRVLLISHDCMPTTDACPPFKMKMLVNVAKNVFLHVSCLRQNVQRFSKSAYPQTSTEFLLKHDIFLYKELVLPNWQGLLILTNF